MLDIGIAEFLVIGAVALLVVGPKELPALMARLGRWMGKARAMARHARAGFDAMVREAEIEEMNKRWEAENARIMAMTQGQSFPDPAPPQPDIIDPPPAATTTPLAPMAESNSVLPGADGDAGDPHAWKRPAGATTATAGAAPAPAGSADAAGQGTTGAPDPATPDDPTDWRDPPATPVMRPLAGPAPAASPPAAPAAAMLPLDLPAVVAPGPAHTGPAPAAATAAAAGEPAAPPAAALPAGAAAPARPARRRKPALPAPPAA